MDSENLLNYSVGLLFLLFGFLKLAGENAVKEMIAETIFIIPMELFFPLLAVWEITIGICLIYKPLNKLGLFLFIPHILGTFLPLIISPEKIFTAKGLSLQAHYIIKNIVLIAAVFHTQRAHLIEIKTSLLEFLAKN